jgi:hypothetical protein
VRIGASVQSVGKKYDLHGRQSTAVQMYGSEQSAPGYLRTSSRFPKLDRLGQGRCLVDRIAAKEIRTRIRSMTMEKHVEQNLVNAWSKAFLPSLFGAFKLNGPKEVSIGKIERNVAAPFSSDSRSLTVYLPRVLLRLGHDQKLHEKKLQERAALLRKLEKQAAEIMAQTTEVKTRLAGLQAQHEQHARIREIQVSSQAARRNATERMKSLVTQRQLQDIGESDVLPAYASFSGAR